MSQIKCEKGHTYDAEKFLSCPHCANQMAGVSVEDILGQNQNRISTAIPTPATLSNYRKLVSGKTVGWLVCIEGTMVGESFVLREGDNYIGRAANMDIALLYEATVSREKHAIITYDSARNVCVLYSPEHADQTFCNDKKVKTKKTLKNRDMLTFGESSFLYIPFCNTSFSWNNKYK